MFLPVSEYHRTRLVYVFNVLLFLKFQLKQVSFKIHNCFFLATYLQQSSDESNREIPENATSEEHQAFRTTPESQTAENYELLTSTTGDFSPQTSDTLVLTEDSGLA